jgi:hypothetical protein
MSHRITLKNGSVIRTFPVATRACENCVHFVASNITPSKGLCGLYSEIVAQDDSCRRGFEGTHERVEGHPASRIELMDEPDAETD